MADIQREASSTQKDQETPSAAPPSAAPPSTPPTSTAAPPYRPEVGRTRSRTGWAGWVVFAGIMMILIGAFQVIDGLVALFRDQYYYVTSNGLLLTVDYSSWGWVHLILGLVLIAAGFAVMRGALWGRVIGVVLACVSALVNLAFLAAYPVWSALIIALDVLVIFALTVHGSEVKD